MCQKRIEEDRNTSSLSLLTARHPYIFLFHYYKFYDVKRGQDHEVREKETQLNSASKKNDPDLLPLIGRESAKRNGFLRLGASCKTVS